MILCASQLIRGDDFLSEYFSEAHVYVDAASAINQEKAFRGLLESLRFL